MNKKVKILFSVIAFIIIILTANYSFAATASSSITNDGNGTTIIAKESNNGVSAVRWSHVDIWTGTTEMMAQNLSETDAVGATMCMDKGGALRYTPSGIITGKISTGGLDGNVFHSNYNDCSAHGDTTSHTGDLPAGGQVETNVSTAVEHAIANAVRTTINSFEGSEANQSSGIWARYGNANYNFREFNIGDSPAQTGYHKIVAKSKPYTREQEYRVAVTRTVDNNNNPDYAYILSSGKTFNPIIEFGLKQGNYAGTYSDLADTQLVQHAVWASSINIGRKVSGPEVADALIEESVAYKNIRSQLDNYQVSFGNTNPQVIVNRNTGKYIIGPYRVQYPADTRFSYIQDIYIIDENGNKIDTTTLNIICASGTIYPLSGENFFVEFNKEVGENYPKVGLKVEFAYLASTYASYEEYQGSGIICQLLGTVERKGSIRNMSWTVNEWHTERKQVEIPGEYDENGRTKTEWQDVPVWGPVEKRATCEEHWYEGHIYEAQIGTYNSQRLLVIKKAERKWKTTEIETPLPKFLDLRMNLGGIVWVDEEGGKESVANGIIDSGEKRVGNVIVELYVSGETTPIKTTKTNSEGVYRFEKLNAMKKYYVKFIYNGQYYQPTYYTSPNDSINGWDKGTWAINSNATDTRSEREAYNNKFASIGSSPNNYGENKQTFTKQQLLGYTLNSSGEYVKTREAVIDEFGNLILENSSDATTQKMIEYAKDCRMNAYTGPGNGTYDLYPTPNVFSITQEPVVNRELLGIGIQTLYPAAYYINLGLNPRPEADVAIKKDVDKVTLEINGQKQEYTYDTIENTVNAEGDWDISVRLSDYYYNTNYSRELYKSDYLYEVENYGTNFADLGKSEEDELKVFITYKIMVRNQSMSIRTKIDEIVDYYDSDLTYVDERSYIQIRSDDNAGIYSVNKHDSSRYGSSTETNIPGYDKLYIRGLDDKYLLAGQTAYIFLTFEVKKDENGRVLLDEELFQGTAIGVGKENIVEINGYSTQYAPGTTVPNVGDVGGKPAGIVDRDSNPGNLNPADVVKDGSPNYNNFEDDTDKSPNIRVKLYRDDDNERVISGISWEDERTEVVEAAIVGDGIRQDGEKAINGITVQLVELMENGTEFIWSTFDGTGTKDRIAPIINVTQNGQSLVSDYVFETSHDGQYAFKSFIPGKYVVRFIYGDTVKTVTPASLNMGGLNEKSYNGQDFKSTTYQEGIVQNKSYDWRKVSSWNVGQETLGDLLTTVTTFKPDASNNETAKATLNAEAQKGYLYDITASDAIANVSDAKDIESRRNEVIDYSDGNVSNYIAEVLASHKSDYNTMNDREQLLNDLMANTQMVAETGLIVVEFEYDRAQTPGQTVNNSATYKIENVDLGLEERAKAQIAVDKEVTNVKLTLSDGSVLFDAKSTASNVLWRDHKEYDVGYRGNIMDPSKFGNIENIRTNNALKVGRIQLTMDEELMHGATIKISYKIKATNVGEVDYKDNLFYYTGNVSDTNTVVTTRVDKLIDYVNNNLQFYEADNSNWKVISIDDIKSQGLVNSALNDQLDKFNTIIVTEGLAEDLVPTLYKDKVNRNSKDSVEVPLVLTQLITSENEGDDLKYDNVMEVVQISNTVGRRMEYSVSGNQDPLSNPQEIDSDKSETVTILPPYGDGGIYIIMAVTVIAALGIIIIGAIFIKKKVLRK